MSSLLILASIFAIISNVAGFVYNSKCLSITKLFSAGKGYMEAKKKKVFGEVVKKKTSPIKKKEDEGEVILVDNLKVRKIMVPSLMEALDAKEMFYYEVCDWTWWDEVSTNGAVGEASATTEGNVPNKAKEIEKKEKPVYVFGSFTYGAKLWPSCLAVALGLVRDKDLMKGKSIVDVGCGVGLVSFTAAALGASHVAAIDIAPLTLKLVEKTSSELGYSDIIKTQEFDLFKDTPLPPGDICIFADVLYTKALGRGVAKRVAEAKERGSWVIIGSTKEREGRKSFMEELVLLGVTETFEKSDRNDVPVTLSEIGWKSKYVEILEINRPKPE
eukprot:CAMPEP_0119051226 /NCGR_PEP_ID=MMETSP1177-20130426/72908_1 /TAXON_ID=2985 /ORGANISM="Ochromonas sp, Strain CCMP1899" /LENGTH=329 /DNA_ID=CAMNT_0007030357 /DNA_START=79 /DNA_END=1068 /DNA_ORIENTATION=+